MTLALAKWGNGQAIRIPQSLLRAVRVADNASFDVSLKGRQIVLTPTENLPTLEELLADCDGAGAQRYDWGAPVGREIL